MRLLGKIFVVIHGALHRLRKSLQDIKQKLTQDVRKDIDKCFQDLGTRHGNAVGSTGRLVALYGTKLKRQLGAEGKWIKMDCDYLSTYLQVKKQLSALQSKHRNS